MTNSLTITLTEFKALGSSETYCGYVAMDSDADASCRVANTWEGFKDQFPTLESLIDAILGETSFSHLNPEYEVNGLAITVVGPQDELSTLQYIDVEGADAIYGSGAVPSTGRPGSATTDQPANVLAICSLLREALEFEVGEIDQPDFEMLKAKAAPHLL